MLIPAVRCIEHQTLTCKTVSPEVSELDLSSVLVWTFCFCLQVFCDETSIDNLSSGAPGMRLKLVFGSGSVFVLEICPSPAGRWSASSRRHFADSPSFFSSILVNSPAICKRNVISWDGIYCIFSRLVRSLSAFQTRMGKN